ncbi:MAG: fatty acid cis/trans isomerase [Cellvibrionaceae bacterium]
MTSPLLHAKKIKFACITVVTLVIVGCTSLAVMSYDSLFGQQNIREYTPESQRDLSYEQDIRPIMEKRCVVCHGCYDAPCQLKLESYQGILRGGTEEQVYNGRRLLEGRQTRLFQDAQTTAAWREMDFHPVINEREDTAKANLQAGLMAKMLELKKSNPLPGEKILPDTFDFSLEREQQCTTIEEFDAFAKEHPQWGMPFGMIDIPENEYSSLRSWLAQGAKSGMPKPLSEKSLKNIESWESFFNGSSAKEQLVSRYLFEHLYLAHLYFEDLGNETSFFKLVRSKTPPGQPIERIATRRPYDDPKVKRVYYRLWKDPSSIIDKTHMPYLINKARQQKWSEWFFETEYSVEKVPSYTTEKASNPFITFEAIPAFIRHSFLLDEGQYTIMNFIKGAVCRGSIALNVIQDNFWVFFVAPSQMKTTEFSKFLSKQDKHLRMPAAAESGFLSIGHWRTYAKSQQRYLKAKGEFVRKHYKDFDQSSLSMIWDGYGKNPNAALTVFRHFDSATVVKGLVGEPPQTAWVIDYPILERIHYLLVAGFDVFGSVSHQAMTRMYMDFLRMESEMNFLAFLPDESRASEVSNWYRNATDEVEDYFKAYFQKDAEKTSQHYTTEKPKLELYQALKSHLGNSIANNKYHLGSSDLPKTSIDELKKLRQVIGIPAAILPQSLFINIQNYGALTLLSNNKYTNITSMFDESDRHLKNEDTLTIANGFIGAYPNVLLDISVKEIPEMVEMIQLLKTEKDYTHFLDRFGVRRTNEHFWKISDELHKKAKRQSPLESGIFDFNRIQNR